MSKYISKRFDSLKEYVPGEQPKERKFIKLNTNESPYPPSAATVKAASDAAGRVNLYSDPTLYKLRGKLSALYGLEPENVIVTNGSDEALNFAFMAYCDKDTGAAFPDISYGFYKVFGMLHGIDCLEIPLEADFSIDIKKYFGLGRTVFIANPNAPTGLALTLSDIEEILKHNKDNVVVIDEAYVDFGTDSAAALIGKYDNLLVTQTFSKSRSLAGARVGFAMGSKALIADLDKIRNSTNPYNVNSMSLEAGSAAVDDNAYYMSNCQKVMATRNYMLDGLKALGFELTDSKANFVFAKHGKIGGKELYLKLREKGILVRHFDAPRISEYNRITVGTDAEAEALLLACREILK